MTVLDFVLAMVVAWAWCSPAAVAKWILRYRAALQKDTDK